MAKIIVRLPDREQYAYTEITFDSIEEYERDFLKVASAREKARFYFGVEKLKAEKELKEFEPF